MNKTEFTFVLEPFDDPFTNQYEPAVPALLEGEALAAPPVFLGSL